MRQGQGHIRQNTLRVPEVAPIQQKRARPVPLSPSLQLHRTLGNQGVQRLLATHTLQAKLRVSQPDDPYEQEADRVAERVMRVPASTQTSDGEPCPTCAASGATCPKCFASQHDWLAGRRGIQTTLPTVSDGLAGRLGSGRPLDAGTRAFFESRFGRDFGQVLVHTDTSAAQAARTLDARALTVGRDIAFGASEFRPDTTGGRRLLAHELTHVLQQGGAPERVVAPPTDHDFDSANVPTGQVARDVSVRSLDGGETIQRACVAGLIPQLRCCIPGLSARRVGSIAHRQLQLGAGIVSPGTIGEVAIPPTPRGVTPPRRGWRFADLYDTNPASPIAAPSRSGLPPFLGRFHPEINPLGLPVARVPPASTAASAGLGEIKPLSPHGLRAGPADLLRNVLQYNLWSLSLSGGPITASPVIPGGFLGHPLSWLMAFRTLPGVYHYCCFDARRLARAIKRVLRRLWERVRDLWRRLLEWLGENWELVAALALIIIAIILIIVFWEAIVAGILAIGAAIAAFLAWLASVLAPATALAGVVLLLILLTSSQEASAQPAPATEGVPELEIDESPEGRYEPSETPALPFGIPPEMEDAGAAIASSIETALGGVLDMIQGYRGEPESAPMLPPAVSRALVTGAPVAISPLLAHIAGSPMHDEARRMVEEFLARLRDVSPGERPRSAD